MAIRPTIILLTVISFSLLVTSRVQAETIQYRIDNNLSELKYSIELTDFAYSRQQELCMGDWSHNGFYNRYSILSNSFTEIGENLGRGYGGVDTVVFNAWLNSPTHYNNVIKPTWTHIGKAKFNCNNETYWVEIFGQAKHSTEIQAIKPMSIDLTEAQEQNNSATQENQLAQIPKLTIKKSLTVQTIKLCSIYDQIMKPYMPQDKSLWQKVKEHLILLVN